MDLEQKIEAIRSDISSIPRIEYPSDQLFDRDCDKYIEILKQKSENDRLLRKKSLALALMKGRLLRSKRAKPPLYSRIINYFRKKDRIGLLEDRISVLEKELNKYSSRKPVGYVSKYNHLVAPSQMKRDIVREYCMNYTMNLDKIAKDISKKYHMNISPKTMRKYARLELGARISRRDKSAKEAYRLGNNSQR